MQPGQSANNSAVEAKDKKGKKKRNRKKDGLGEGGTTEEAIASGATGGSSQGKESCAKREERREEGSASGGEGSDRAASIATAVFGRDEAVAGNVKSGTTLSDEQFEMAMLKFAKRLEAHCSEVVS